MIKKYRKLPVIIEAVQFGKIDTKELLDFIRDNKGKCQYRPLGGIYDDDGNRIGEKTHLIVNTLEGETVASIGDYIIKGVNGEFYPCKPDIFKKTYEEVVG